MPLAVASRLVENPWLGMHIGLVLSRSSCRGLRGLDAVSTLWLLPPSRPPLPPPASQVTDSANFQSDLGLDSLDTVELVMALEEEFAIEIPDAEADKILSVPEAIAYIAANPMAK